MRRLGIAVAIISALIGYSSLNIFYSFAHTQLLPDVACGEDMAKSVPRDIEAEYERECRTIKENIETGLDVALDKSVFIGILALILLVLGLSMVMVGRKRL